MAKGTAGAAARLPRVREGAAALGAPTHTASVRGGRRQPWAGVCRALASGARIDDHLAHRSDGTQAIREGGRERPPPHNPRQTLTEFRRKEFAITETEDNAIAAAAIIGDRRSPVIG